MRRKCLRVVLGFCLLCLLAAAPLTAAVSISFSYFHDELAPHGRWVTVARYGDVWCPSGLGAGWEPYTNGEWVYTDYGWTWVSDDPWGGDPYHYGTWTVADPYGWCWVPGYVWSPAWVTWSYSTDYVGWAPIPPTLEISASGYFGPPVVVERTRYVFVPVNRFVGTRVATVRVPPQQNAVILGRARNVTTFRVAGGIVRNEGPSVKTIERAVGAPIRKTSLSQVRTQPMPISAAGAVAKGRKISVVAPPQTRTAEAGRAAQAKGSAKAQRGPAGSRSKESAHAAERHRPAERPATSASSSTGEKRHAEPGTRKAQPAEARKAHPAPRKPVTTESPSASHEKRAHPAAPAADASARHAPPAPVREAKPAPPPKEPAPNGHVASKAPQKHSPARPARREPQKEKEKPPPEQ